MKVLLTVSQGSGRRQLDLSPPDLKTFRADRSRRTDKPVTGTSLASFGRHFLKARGKRPLQLSYSNLVAAICVGD